MARCYHMIVPSVACEALMSIHFLAKYGLADDPMLEPSFPVDAELVAWILEKAKPLPCLAVVVK